jgi:alpha-glucosidase
VLALNLGYGLGVLFRQGLTTVAAVVLLSAPAQAWTVRSPDRAVTATITTAGRTATLTARHRGRTVLTADLGRVRAAHVRRGRVRESFTTPAGKRRRHVLDARTLAIGGVEVLAADDGVAFRRSRRAVWRAGEGTRAWLQPYSSVYENRYAPTRLRAAPPRRYGFPALLRTGRDWALLTESGLPYGASGAHLRARRGRLAVEPGGAAWRVALVGSLGAIVGSDLPLALGRRSKVRDTSWIEPGRAAWSWWADAGSTRSLARQEQYVDFASAEHFEYTTVDAGWDPAWVPDLAAYAAARHVRLVLWTDWHALANPARRTATLDRWASWGVAGIKVDYLQSDAGRRLAVMEDIARAAAARHLVVDFHGCTIPRALQRTWPNVLALEAVRGAEYQRDGTPSSPRNNVDLAFTRNVVGSMDYTPVTFSARHRVTTAGHELAMSVVYESGLQHYADTPESYRSHPAATSLLAGVPAAWDDTRLVAGRPDRFVTLARRAGRRWYVGALGAGPARTLTIPLRFLAKGGYDARIIGDDLAETHRTVTRAGTLHVAVARNGGAVIELTPR